MTPDPPSLVVLLPVFNDWDALDQLLPRLDAALDAAHLRARVVIADDGSTQPPALPYTAADFAAITHLNLLRLRRNLGHQRAIGIGLTYIHGHIDAEIVVVMDADGQDRPEDVPCLVAACKAPSSPVVFAARMRRAESLSFRFFYHNYRWVHRALVGLPVRVGNFSAVPRAQRDRLVVVSELWNHFSAAVFNARIPIALVPSERGRRLAGDARMDFTALVAHGLSAISVHSATVGIRLLVFTAVLALAVLALLAGLLLGPALGLLPRLENAAWVAGIVLLLLVQLAMLSFGLVVFVLNGRERLSFLPLRDYQYFVLETRALDLGTP